jgi:hypothetical protein
MVLSNFDGVFQRYSDALARMAPKRYMMKRQHEYYET